MKIIIAPDKFKGSLSSFDVCAAIETGIRTQYPNASLHLFPMADGGDGFASILQYYLHTKQQSLTTVDPLGRTISSSYQWSDRQEKAIVELASASGLVLLTQQERDPMKASTLGTGLLVRDAISQGARKILLGLGGSATNDGGTGILSALGFSFFDASGEPLLPNGENLLFIDRIAPPAVIPSIAFEIACDVQNVLCGPDGAAYVYAPQKGADDREVKRLDDGLRNFAQVLMRQTGKDIATIPGTGAAGGVAAGLMAFFEVTLKKGIDLVIEASQIQSHLPGASVLITGEGRIDNQSGTGKVVGSMAALAAEHAIPCIAFCGTFQLSAAEQKALGLQQIIAIKEEGMSSEESMKEAASLLTKRTALMQL